jgi:ribonuclease T
MSENNSPQISQRFRGFLPVVVDVETAGFNAETDALLEIAAVTVRMDDDGTLRRSQTVACHVEPFPGANLEQRALDFTGIDPYNPFRMAKKEKEALEHIFAPIREEVKAQGCTRAILVGHNPFFDLGFLNAAIARTNHKKSPFHSFSSFDTATLAGLAYGQTVLAKACAAAGVEFDSGQAHSAIYDTERTAELFCTIVNRWRELGGCPLL